jgi:tetratricopeptide (TPR) repeat protein
MAAGLLLVVAGSNAQNPPGSNQKSKSQPEAEEQAPPEEDESAAPKQYSFNPLQASKDVRVGNYYFKKGNYKGAARRYREATRWNDGNADAWLRLAEASEKQDDTKAAREAYEKYLQLSPDAKNAAEIRKKIEKLKG